MEKKSQNVAIDFKYYKKIKLKIYAKMCDIQN